MLGVLFVVAPIAGGLFSRAAAGQQMLDAFAPHMNPDSLARYGGDLAVLRKGESSVAAIYARDHVAPGRFPGLDAWQKQHARIQADASSLLAHVSAAEPDYQATASVSGFDRMPFLIVVFGLVAAYAGVVMLIGRRPSFVGPVVLVVVVAAALVAYPFLAKLPSGTSAGHELVAEMAPVMTAAQVSELQTDFVVLVTAVGELDTGFAKVPSSGPSAQHVITLVREWPQVSSDLAALTGAINDNLPDYGALAGLDHVTRPLGVSGLRTAPWAMVGAGAVGAALALAARPRRRKEPA